nr:MarR family winged helix-turn-helix transcriptional regulator [Microbacterium bovistercoris]
MPVNPDDLSHARPRISRLSRVIHDAYGRAVDSALVAAGFPDLTGGRAKVLPFVRDDGIALGRLAALVGVRKQTVAEMVTQLERDGYVRTELNPDDARSRLVVLTDRGQRARPVAVSAGERVERDWAELTSRALVERLRSDLQTLINAIETGSSENP